MKMPPLERFAHFHSLPNGVPVLKLWDTDLVVSNFETFSYSKKAREWAEVATNRAVWRPKGFCDVAYKEFWALVVAIRAFDAGLNVQFGSDITEDPMNVLVVDKVFKTKALKEHPLGNTTPSLSEALELGA